MGKNKSFGKNIKNNYKNKPTSSHRRAFQWLGGAMVWLKAFSFNTGRYRRFLASRWEIKKIEWVGSSKKSCLL
jgi:hypothetical protein